MRPLKKHIRLNGKGYFLLRKCLLEVEYLTKDERYKTHLYYGCDPEFLKEYILSHLAEGMTMGNMRMNGWAIHLIDRNAGSRYDNLQPRWIGGNEWQNKYLPPIDTSSSI